ncbi:cytochrome c [Sedimentitalea nanhaiensis]|uniref:Cytochrome c, mono-and diheme variants n=1 Tax=Sedimentitalea nanhaiensis TaxID=999627 RepID=A0A1I6YGL8_9RHOB|nr:cytochrome c [Sedimentitalea nanhaiensis]SFT49689.1 Cytochrome c, mono-and diheme variants [Sedimentitalea nanhaiensis]
MRSFLKVVVILGLAVAGALWVLSRPNTLPADAMNGLVGDPERGETVFWAGGCASCHAAPKAEGEEKLVLSGGYRIDSPFGTFLAPNISPGPAGIGAWSAQDLANALIAGVSPQGQHLYPALPYTTYTHMRTQDVADLKAYMDTLPVSDVASLPHELSFPFNIRRGLGLWKRINLTEEWTLTQASTPEIERGRYLVEALGHCAECHTPRDITGGLDRSRWMQGAPNPSGKGKIPAIDPANLTWSAGDIAYYLETGFTPEYDSAGGQMAKVVAGMAHLDPDDRAAIAAYLKALP